MITIHTTSNETPDVLWQQYDQLVRSMKPEPTSSRDMRTQTLELLDEELKARVFLLVRDDRVIGRVMTNAFGITNERTRIILDPLVPESEADASVLNIIASIANESMERHGNPRVYIKTREPHVQYIAESLGAKKIAEIRHAKLTMGRANIELMERILAEQSKRWPMFALRFYDRLPDEIIDEYAEAFSEFINGMPDYHEHNDVNPDVFRRRQERQSPFKAAYRYMVVDPNGRIAGHTNVMVDLETMEASQHMTGVRETYRGRGFGLWMKSAMYFRLREDFPELRSIATDTLAQNSYMQAINRSLGYEVTGDGAEYRITKA